MYDYVQYNFHSSLTEVNADSTNWSAIEYHWACWGFRWNREVETAIRLVKVIGLLQHFCLFGSKINSDFPCSICPIVNGGNDILPLMGKLEKAQIIRFAKYKSKYILFEGYWCWYSNGALQRLPLECKRTDDYIDKLSNFLHSHFNRQCSLLPNRDATLFEYQITDEPITKVRQGEIDGIIDLIFAKITRLPHHNRQMFVAERHRRRLLCFQECPRDYRPHFWNRQCIGCVISTSKMKTTKWHTKKSNLIEYEEIAVEQVSNRQPFLW